MIEVKINEKEFVNAMLNETQELLKKEIREQISGFIIWDDEKLSSQINKFFQELVDEILNENKEKIKKEVEQAVMDLAKEITLEIVAEKLS